MLRKFRSLEKSVRGMMANIDELNKSISAYGKYVSDKQRHDNTIFNLTQKRTVTKDRSQSSKDSSVPLCLEKNA
uniref:t-SNARE coiled-coil homology domain-containing protein n=1 Tax=Heterorhabditis bacteriophora TaxID=37862 RepID=A0A1I7WFY2_HETBA